MGTMNRLIFPLLALTLAAQAPPVVELDSVRVGNRFDAKLQALLAAKNLAGAADLLEGAAAEDQKANRMCWLEVLGRTKRWPRLVSLCETILKEPVADPRSQILVHLTRIQALNAQGDHRASALANLDVAALGFPKHYPAALASARVTEDWAFLQDIAARVLEKVPGDGEALAWKGEALVKQGNYKDAEPWLEEASRKVPDRAMVWADLAGCRQARGASVEALEAADRAIALDPATLEARYNRVCALLALKRYADAQPELAATLALAKDSGLRATLEDLQRRTDRYLASQARKAASPSATGRRR